MKRARKHCLIPLVIALTVMTALFSVTLSADGTPDIWDGTIATSFAGGTGTEADPYIIQTPEQLAYLAKQVNAGTNYKGQYFKLANDIVLNDTSNWENRATTAPANTWTPIGNSSNYFSGVFDGNGHTISGLYTDSTKDYQGLLGYSNGTIQNLGIEKSYICGSNYVGGVCGRNQGIINNCYNTGTVSGRYWAIGGVCGFNENTISNCYNTGAVSGSENVGGMCGYSNGTVSNCYNTGTVSGSYKSVGGVCGDNSGGTISNCYNTGAVSGSSYNVGGVCGGNSSSATIGNCYNTGKVNGNYSVGGVCGDNGSTISNCYNTGAVIGNQMVGGVCGHNYDAIGHCYYLTGCAEDGKNTVQYGIGNEAMGNTTADISGKTTGLTETEMKLQASFEGFDFLYVWVTEPSTGYEYPQFVRYLNESFGEASAVWDGVVATSFESGIGTEEDPYMIKTAGQLAYLAQQVNAGTTYSDTYFKLADDITLNDTGKKYWILNANVWMPIGTDATSSNNNPFSGTFDGDGHTISGLYTDNAKNYQGLFGYSKGTIQNLGIESSYICGDKYVGGVCGKNDGTISNCHNAGTVSGNHNVGGVCGYNNSYSRIGSCYSAISNCFNTGSVSGSENVGGVCGCNGDLYGNYTATISSCHNTGTVSGGSCVGGVCGENYSGGTISNCYNTGTVIGNQIIGGVCGNGDVSNCYNTGTVSGNYYVGGVCGDGGTISNCYNTGIVGGNYYIGGVCGYNYSDGAINNCYNIGTVSGSSYVGGVCGSGYAASCYNIGTVRGNKRVGGVCGYSGDFSIISNCYYLAGCAKDGNGTVQYGIGNSTQGSTTADVNGQTTGLTEAEMKIQSSFIGFDFEMVWTIGVISDYDYPTLRWQKDSPVPQPQKDSSANLYRILIFIAILVLVLALAFFIFKKKKAKGQNSSQTYP